MVLRFCIKLLSCMLNAEPNHYNYLLLKSAFKCWEYFPPPNVAKWRKVGIADHINSLLHCDLNLKQMGQDALAEIQCEHVDLHRAFHFKYGDEGTGPGH